MKYAHPLGENTGMLNLLDRYDIEADRYRKGFKRKLIYDNNGTRTLCSTCLIKKLKFEGIVM